MRYGVLEVVYAVILIAIMVFLTSLGTVIIVARRNVSIAKASALAALFSQFIVAPLAIYFSILSGLLEFYNLSGMTTLVSVTTIVSTFLLSLYLNTRRSLRKYIHPILYAPRWLVVIASIIVAPLGEEVIFRLLLLDGLSTMIGIIPGTLLASSIFTLLHYQALPPKALPGVFILSLLLSLPPLIDNNITASILAHSLANVIGLLANGGRYQRIRESKVFIWWEAFSV